MATLAGTFTATGQSANFIPRTAERSTVNAFNIFLYGTSVATVQLERSFDQGTTWTKIYAGGVQLYRWVYDGSTLVNISETMEEPEQGIWYRLNCTSYTSGTLSYRISQGL